MTGYTKLFPSIIHSTIWREPHHVRLVWVTMLAMADRDGRVEASIPGLADAARVELVECEEALARLAAPDRYSRTPEHDGRRIRSIDGGWELINYTRYRLKLDRDEQRSKDAERKRKARAESARRGRGRTRPDAGGQTGQSANVRAVPPDPKKSDKAEAEAEAEAEREKSALARVSSDPLEEFSMHPAWQPSSETVQSLAIGGIPEWASRAIAVSFRTHFVNTPRTRRTSAAWNQSFSKWVAKDWQDPTKKPKPPEVAEGDDLAARFALAAEFK